MIFLNISKYLLVNVKITHIITKANEILHVLQKNKYKMTSNTVLILNEFKKGLISFFDELIEQFPEQGDLVVIRILLKDQLPVTQIMNYFIANVLPEKQMVKERNQKFFTESNALFGLLGNDRANNLKNIWKSPKLDKDDRDVMWKWIDTFIMMVEKYQKNMEN